MFLALPARTALGVSYVVDTTDDDASVVLTACTGGAAPDCSLRGAITNANAPSTPGDLITFDAAVFPVATPATITISSALPAMSGGSDTISATNRGVIIDGAGEPSAFTCLTASSNNNNMVRLQVTDCSIGISVGGAGSGNNIVENVVFDNNIGIATSTEANGNTIDSNKVGTNAAGTAVHTSGGNGQGIQINSDNNTIGSGLNPPNVIAGNNSGGVVLNSGADGNIIRANRIGTDGLGTAVIANVGNGVTIQGNNNTVGGAGAGLANIIANSSSGRGVSVISGTGNKIERNSIYSNASLGIDLTPAGVTANDGGDGDTGANNLQNFPVLTSVTSSLSGTSILGSFNSTASTSFTIEFFGNDACDGSQNGEGQRFLGSISVITDGSGNAPLNHLIATPAGSGEVVTATATDPSGNTSEFSACAAVPDMVVNSSLDPGDGTCDLTECTLREAMALANAVAGPDLITFDATVFPPPPDAPAAITIGSVLPTLTGGKETIDASGRGVIIDGAGEPSGFNCINLQGGGNVIKGLQITDCGHGISIISSAPNNIIGPGNTIFDNLGSGITMSSSGNRIVGNKIGTDSSGEVNAAGGNFIGISVGSSNGNMIGGSDPADRNVVSGNFNGLVITNGDGNIAKGNYIGTNGAGTTTIPNTGAGVGLQSGADGNTIGGAGAGEGNVISGNGVGVFVSSGSGNTVQGNRIGTDAAGNVDLGNATDGVGIEGGGNNHVLGNLISGNGAFGVLVNTSNDNELASNKIGTKVDGVSPLGNSSHAVVVSASNNLLGVTNLGGENTIAFNGGFGINILSGTGNTMGPNHIYSNGLLGIGLDNDGVTPNDAGDGDSGPNNLQNFPLLTNLNISGGTTTIDWSLDSAQFTMFTFEFFYNSSCDDSGHGEGETFFGSSTQTTSGGPSSFSASFPLEVPPGRFITATATGPDGTSEFWPCVASLDDADDDNDGFSDVNEAGTPLCLGGVNEDRVFDGGELLINDGCPAVGAPEANCTDGGDTDGDGSVNDGCPQVGTFSEAQFKIGTSQQDPCGNTGWPLEFVTTGGSANKFDLVDLASFVAPVRHIDKNPGETGFSSRWDLVPGSIGSLKFINLADMAAAITGSTGFPPMLGAGVKAFGGPACPFPP